MLTPYPGTQIYYDGLAEGLYDHDFWREFAADPRPDFSPLSWTENFTQDQLQGFLQEAYRRFYCRPGYVLKRILRVRSVGELLRKGRLGFKMLRGMLLEPTWGKAKGQAEENRDGY